MEEKLYAAASKLPEPRCSFTNLEALAEERKQRKRPNRRKRLVLLAMALCLLITACAYGSTKYGLWGGYASNSYKDAKRTAEKFNYTIPETLKESPFQTYSEAHGAPEGYTRLQALLMPTYKLYNVFYAVEKQEIREDGGTYSWQENVISVYFGTTEQEPWKYHFSVAEDGSKNYHGVNPGSKRVVLGCVDLTEYDGEKAFVSILIVGLYNRRKGFAENALRLLVDYAKSLGLHTLYARILPENLPSKNLFEKVGFERGNDNLFMLFL